MIFRVFPNEMSWRVKSISRINKVFTHFIRSNLRQILFQNISGLVMHKAKNSKILTKKQPNYIIAAELKVGRIFLKFWKLDSKLVYK